MQLHDLIGKRVLLWGSGREAAAFLHAIDQRQLSIDVTVADEQGDGTRQLANRSVVRLDQELLDAADVVVRSPGVSRYRAEVERAISRGTMMTTATNLWFAEPHAPAIGVTGTKGKSTTSSLIATLLEGAGLRATLAGNIGQNPLDLLDDPQPDWWVLELSSYQSSDLMFSPEIGVLTNLSPEHLDWHGSYETYVADKINLFAHNPRVVIIDGADEESVRATETLSGRIEVGTDEYACIRDGSFCWQDQQLFSRSVLPLAGKHNERLLCLALTAVANAGVDLVAHAERLAAAVSGMRPLPHRLNVVGEYSGRTYINDSLSTTPVASLAALEAYADRPITLLVGGFDRGLDYDELAAYVASRPDVRVVTLPDSGQRIAETIRRAVMTDGTRSDESKVIEAGELLEAVEIAIEQTPDKGVVLLSPGAPSFGRFRDYSERGQAFAQYVMERAGCN